MNPIIVPIRLLSAGNLPEHWSKRHVRNKKQKGAVRYILSPRIDELRQYKIIELKRLAPRTLDYDNLVFAFKHIRDGIADMLHPGLAPGRADEFLTFSYSQSKSSDYAISIVGIAGAI